MGVVKLMELLGDSVKVEEFIEGKSDDGHEHDNHSDEHDEHEVDHNEHDDENSHTHDEEFDEHIWLSLRHAAFLCNELSAILGDCDTDYASTYSANAAAYSEALQNLDAHYATRLASAPQQTLLFGDRFPFRYLTDDYGLSYYAAFRGCSAETEASFETIIFLADKLDKLNLDYVLSIEGSTHRIAQTIIESSSAKNQVHLQLDSMQSTTAADVRAGANYLAIMEQNLELLCEALGAGGAS